MLIGKVFFTGDKESYWLAFELAGIPYYFVDHYAGGVGNDPWQGQFCSDHPLHFLPELSEEAPIDEVIFKSDKGDSMEQTSTKKKRPGRPAWFNGSLMENKGKSGTTFMKQTAWAVDSPWIFLEDLERWCLPNSNYSGDSLESLGKDTLLNELIDAAKEADDALSSLDTFMV